VRVLVTGANRFVGRHLCAHLRDLGDTVTEASGPEEMMRIWGVEARVQVDPERLRPTDLPSLIGDPARILRLGWIPSRTVGDALREALDEAAAAA